jgi:hypothetical protein
VAGARTNWTWRVAEVDVSLGVHLGCTTKIPTIGGAPNWDVGEANVVTNFVDDDAVVVVVAAADGDENDDAGPFVNKNGDVPNENENASANVHSQNQKPHSGARTMGGME